METEQAIAKRKAEKEMIDVSGYSEKKSDLVLNRASDDTTTAQPQPKAKKIPIYESSTKQETVLLKK